MERFNEKKYWTWKKILVVLGIISILVIVKVFTSPPPSGKNSWREVFDDYLGNRESKALPELIKKYPKETKFLENEVSQVFSSMDVNDMKLMEELTQKAINLLPEDEKQQLMALHIRFNENGYGALTEDEINTMQELNKKAFNLLAPEDRAKLNKIFKKATDVVPQHRLKTLVNNLDHPDVTVRWQAIVELEKLGPKAEEVVQDIIPYLENDDWRVRYYAAEILGLIGSSAKPAIPALQKILNDPDEKVRVRASWALDEISKGKQRNNNGM